MRPQRRSSQFNNGSDALLADKDAQLGLVQEEAPQVEKAEARPEHPLGLALAQLDFPEMPGP